MSAWSAVVGIVARDLARTTRQTSRLLGGLARPFMWLLLDGSGYNAIARLEGGLPYQAFVFPGIVVMAALFGAMLTAIGTVYDREFGMLRLMLASPAGVPAVLTGRAIAAALVGVLQGGIVLACAPLVLPVSPGNVGAGAGALVLAAGGSALLGLLVAARLRSVENFAGVINVVLFPLLFVSGALYPTAAGAAPPRAGQSRHLPGGPDAARVRAADRVRRRDGCAGARGRGRGGVRADGAAVRSGAAVREDEAGRRATVILSGAKDRVGGASEPEPHSHASADPSLRAG